MQNPIPGPDAIQWLGVQYRTILPPAESGGAMSILDTVSPPGSGPPRHIHYDTDETFALLSGDAEFWLAVKRLTRGPGQTVFVPRGMEHTFRVLGDMPSRHLVILTPGGFEGFFAEMARGRYAIPEALERIDPIARRYHLEFTGPPLGADPSETQP